MEGDRGRKFGEKAKKVAEIARKAMTRAGSSWNALDELIREIHTQKDINTSKLKS